MKGDLSIVCTNDGHHARAELALVHWVPARIDGKARVWSHSTRPRELVLEVIAGSTRPNPRPAEPSRVIRRKHVNIRSRADGGQTLTIPKCPRCGWPGREVREERLRAYVEATGDTPRQGILDVRDLG